MIEKLRYLHYRFTDYFEDKTTTVSYPEKTSGPKWWWANFKWRVFWELSGNGHAVRTSPMMKKPTKKERKRLRAIPPKRLVRDENGHWTPQA